MTLSELIKTDDLHWCEEDGKFVPLSRKEIKRLVLICAVCGIEDVSSVTQVIRWAEKTRTAELIFKGIMENRIGFRLLEDDPEPRFFALPLETMDEIDEIEKI